MATSSYEDELMFSNVSALPADSKDHEEKTYNGELNEQAVVTEGLDISNAALKNEELVNANSDLGSEFTAQMVDVRADHSDLEPGVDTVNTDSNLLDLFDSPALNQSASLAPISHSKVSETVDLLMSNSSELSPEMLNSSSVVTENCRKDDDFILLFGSNRSNTTNGGAADSNETPTSKDYASDFMSMSWETTSKDNSSEIQLLDAAVQPTTESLQDLLMPGQKEPTNSQIHEGNLLGGFGVRLTEDVSANLGIFEPQLHQEKNDFSHELSMNEHLLNAVSSNLLVPTADLVDKKETEVCKDEEVLFLPNVELNISSNIAFANEDVLAKDQRESTLEIGLTSSATKMDDFSTPSFGNLSEISTEHESDSVAENLKVDRDHTDILDILPAVKSDSEKNETIPTSKLQFSGAMSSNSTDRDLNIVNIDSGALDGNSQMSMQQDHEIENDVGVVLNDLVKLQNNDSSSDVEPSSTIELHASFPFAPRKICEDSIPSGSDLPSAESSKISISKPSSQTCIADDNLRGDNGLNLKEGLPKPNPNQKLSIELEFSTNLASYNGANIEKGDADLNYEDVEKSAEFSQSNNVVVSVSAGDANLHPVTMPIISSLENTSALDPNVDQSGVDTVLKVNEVNNHCSELMNIAKEKETISPAHTILISAPEIQSAHLLSDNHLGTVQINSIAKLPTDLSNCEETTLNNDVVEVKEGWDSKVVTSDFSVDIHMLGIDLASKRPDNSVTNNLAPTDFSSIATFTDSSNMPFSDTDNFPNPSVQPEISDFFSSSYEIAGSVGLKEKEVLSANVNNALLLNEEDNSTQAFAAIIPLVAESSLAPSDSVALVTTGNEALDVNAAESVNVFDSLPVFNNSSETLRIKNEIKQCIDNISDGASSASTRLSLFELSGNTAESISLENVPNAHEISDQPVSMDNQHCLTDYVNNGATDVDPNAAESVFDVAKTDHINATSSADQLLLLSVSTGPSHGEDKTLNTSSDDTNGQSNLNSVKSELVFHSNNETELLGTNALRFSSNDNAAYSKSSEESTSFVDNNIFSPTDAHFKPPLDVPLPLSASFIDVENTEHSNDNDDVSTSVDSSKAICASFADKNELVSTDAVIDQLAHTASSHSVIVSTVMSTQQSQADSVVDVINEKSTSFFGDGFSSVNTDASIRDETPQSVDFINVKDPDQSRNEVAPDSGDKFSNEEFYGSFMDVNDVSSTLDYTLSPQAATLSPKTASDLKITEQSSFNDANQMFGCAVDQENPDKVVKEGSFLNLGITVASPTDLNQTKTNECGEDSSIDSTKTFVENAEALALSELKTQLSEEAIDNVCESDDTASIQQANPSSLTQKKEVASVCDDSDSDEGSLFDLDGMNVSDLDSSNGEVEPATYDNISQVSLEFDENPFSAAPPIPPPRSRKKAAVEHGSSQWPKEPSKSVIPTSVFIQDEIISSEELGYSAAEKTTFGQKMYLSYEVIEEIQTDDGDNGTLSFDAGWDDIQQYKPKIDIMPSIPEVSEPDEEVLSSDASDSTTPEGSELESSDDGSSDSITPSSYAKSLELSDAESELQYTDGAPKPVLVSESISAIVRLGSEHDLNVVDNHSISSEADVPLDMLSADTVSADLCMNSEMPQNLSIEKEIVNGKSMTNDNKPVVSLSVEVEKNNRILRLEQDEDDDSLVETLIQIDDSSNSNDHNLWEKVPGDDLISIRTDEELIVQKSEFVVAANEAFECSANSFEEFEENDYNSDDEEILLDDEDEVDVVKGQIENEVLSAESQNQSRVDSSFGQNTFEYSLVDDSMTVVGQDQLSIEPCDMNDFISIELNDASQKVFVVTESKPSEEAGLSTETPQPIVASSNAIAEEYLVSSVDVNTYISENGVKVDSEEDVWKVDPNSLILSEDATETSAVVPEHVSDLAASDGMYPVDVQVDDLSKDQDEFEQEKVAENETERVGEDLISSSEISQEVISFADNAVVNAMHDGMASILLDDEVLSKESTLTPEKNVDDSTQLENGITAVKEKDEADMIRENIANKIFPDDTTLTDIQLEMSECESKVDYELDSNGEELLNEVKDSTCAFVTEENKNFFKENEHVELNGAIAELYLENKDDAVTLATDDDLKAVTSDVIQTAVIFKPDDDVLENDAEAESDSCKSNLLEMKSKENARIEAEKGLEVMIPAEETSLRADTYSEVKVSKVLIDDAALPVKELCGTEEKTEFSSSQNDVMEDEVEPSGIEASPALENVNPDSGFMEIEAHEDMSNIDARDKLVEVLGNEDVLGEKEEEQQTNDDLIAIENLMIGKDFSNMDTDKDPASCDNLGETLKLFDQKNMKKKLKQDDNDSFASETTQFDVHMHESDASQAFSDNTSGALLLHKDDLKFKSKKDEGQKCEQEKNDASVAVENGKATGDLQNDRIVSSKATDSNFIASAPKKLADDLNPSVAEVGLAPIEQRRLNDMSNVESYDSSPNRNASVRKKKLSLDMLEIESSASEELLDDFSRLVIVRSEFRKDGMTEKRNF